MFEMKDNFTLYVRKNRNGTTGEYVLNDEAVPVAKKCTGCDAILGLDSFSAYKRNKYDGKMGKCKLCTSRKSEKWSDENKDRRKETNKKWYIENKEHVNNRSRTWYEENTERHKEYNKKWHEENPDYLREYHKKWYSIEENRERHKEYNKKWREENEEHVKLVAKKWREENKEQRYEKNKIWIKKNKEHVAWLKKRWVLNNPERMKELTHNWYLENKEHVKVMERKWKEENPERHLANARLKAHRRRTRLSMLPFTLTSDELQMLLDVQDGQCFLTGNSESLHLEHFIPISWGVGGNTFKNCYYMEGTLNISKGNKNPFEWIGTQPEAYQERFYEALVPMLAERNGMTVDDFITYIYECEANKKNK